MATCIFHCWATVPSGAVRRIEVTASTELDARSMAFAQCPSALSVSCRVGIPTEERRHG